MNLHTGLQLWEGRQQDGQGSQMKFVRKALDDALHEVLLCNFILAADNLLHHASLHNILHNSFTSLYDVALDQVG